MAISLPNLAETGDMLVVKVSSGSGDGPFGGLEEA